MTLHRHTKTPGPFGRPFFRLVDRYARFPGSRFGSRRSCPDKLRREGLGCAARNLLAEPLDFIVGRLASMG